MKREEYDTLCNYLADVGWGDRYDSVDLKVIDEEHGYVYIDTVEDGMLSGEYGFRCRYDEIEVKDVLVMREVDWTCGEGGAG